MKNSNVKKGLLLRNLMRENKFVLLKNRMSKKCELLKNLMSENL